AETSKVVMTNSLAKLDRLVHWLQHRFALDLSGDTSLAIQVCLEEAIANIIMYGAVENESVAISVELNSAAGMLVAQIEDTGQEFDPTQAPSLTVAPSLADAKPGGVGIHLMRSFSDEITYRRHGDRNHLTLRFVQ